MELSPEDKLHAHLILTVLNTARTMREAYKDQIGLNQKCDDAYVDLDNALNDFDWRHEFEASRH